MLQLMDMFRQIFTFTVADDRHSFHMVENVTSATLHPGHPLMYTLCTARDDVRWPLLTFPPDQRKLQVRGPSGHIPQ